MARVLVLGGGDNLERRVSLAGSDAVAAGLVAAGHEVLKLDTAHPDRLLEGDSPFLEGAVGPTPPDEITSARLDRNGWAKLTATLAGCNVDCVFPILHGSWGENGGIQALLELMGFPYLGSGVLASRICMNKQITREYACRNGLPIAPGFIIDKIIDELEFECRIEDLGLPVVVKPNYGGSTVDVFIVDSVAGVRDAIAKIRKHGDIPLLEKYIPGKELTVTIIGDSACPVIEIRPKTAFYDYTRKYTSGETEYLCPAPIEGAAAERMMSMSLELFRLIGCRHLARIDWRATEDGDPYFLEVNTIPGMTALSLVPMAAKARGIDFKGLMDLFVKMTLSDNRQK